MIATGVDGVVTYIDLTALGEKKFNRSTDKGLDNDVEVYVNGTRITFADNLLTDTPSEANSLVLTKVGVALPLPTAGDTIKVVVKDYVYFNRDDQNSPWVPQADSDTIRVLYQTEDTTGQNQRYERFEGRFPLNFAWFHHTPRLHLVDPSATNIIDIYIAN